MSTTLSLVACVAVSLSLLATPVVQQDAPAPPAIPALASLDLPLAQLEDSRQEFECRLSTPGSSSPSAESKGLAVLSTKIEAGKFAFTDRADIHDGDKTSWIVMTTLGAVGNELRPTYLDVQSDMTGADGKTYEFTADFTATSATVTYAGQKRETAVPAGSLTVDVLYRLVTLLPRRAGFVTSYANYLDANAMLVKPGGTITCASETEDVVAAGKTVKAFRFDITSDGRLLMSLWVDDAGRLLQTCFDGTRWLVAKG